jgi:hypothetical protein
MLTLAEASEADARLIGTGREVNRWYGDDGRAFARAYVSSDHRWIDWPGVGAFIFEHTSPLVRVRLASGASRHLIDDVFHRSLRAIILQSQGFEALHASGVLVNGSVIALTGRRHSGKSTLAYAIGQAGFATFADDSVVLSCEAEHVTAQAMSFIPRLRPAARTHFGEAAEAHRRQMTPPVSAPLRAIILLRQAEDHDATLMPRRLAGPDALTAVLPHAYTFDIEDPAERRRLVEHYLSMVATVPVFELVYQPDFGRLRELISVVTSVLEPAAASETVHA